MINKKRKDSNTRTRIILPRMSNMDKKLRVDTSIVCQQKASSKNLSSVGDVERTIGSKIFHIGKKIKEDFITKKKLLLWGIWLKQLP